MVLSNSLLDIKRAYGHIETTTPSVNYLHSPKALDGVKLTSLAYKVTDGTRLNPPLVHSPSMTNTSKNNILQGKGY